MLIKTVISKKCLCVLLVILQLNHLTFAATNKDSADHLEGHVENHVVDHIVNQSTTTIGAKNLQDKLSALLTMEGSFKQATTQACVNHSQLFDEDSQSDEMIAMQSAVLARVLIQRLIDRANFDELAKKQFVAHYYHTCPFLIARINVPLLADDHAKNHTEVIEANARALLDYALSMMSKVPHSFYRGFPYEVKWLYYNFKNDHITAAQAARNAIAHYQADNPVIDLAQEFGYLGTSLLQLGQFKEALYYMRKALTHTSKGMVKKHSAGSYFGVAFAYLKVGDYASAKRYLELIMQLENRVLYNQGLASGSCQQYSLVATKALVQLGKIDRIEGRYLDALNKHQCAIKLLKEQSDYYYYVAKLEKTKDLAQLGRFDEAQKGAQSLVNDGDIFDSHKLEALLLLFSMDIKRKPSELNKALEQQIMDLVGISEDKIHYPVEFIALTRLKMVYGAAIDDEKSFASNADIGFKMIEKYRESIVLSDSWMSAQYAFVEDYVNAIYSNKTYSDSHVFELVINVLDNYYSLDYIDENKKFSFGDESDNKPVKLKQLLRQRLSAEQSLINAATEDKPAQQIQLDKAKDALLAYQFVETPQITPGRQLTKLKLSQIQAALKDDEVMVRFIISEQRSLAFVITRAKVFIHPLPPASDIRQSMSLLSHKLNNSKEIVGLMKDETWQNLLPLSFIQDNKFNKLIIIPDDVLHRMPFSAIDTAAVHYSYQSLGSQIEIVRTHSVNDYLFSQTALAGKTRTNSQITIFADPAFDDIDPPLVASNITLAPEPQFRDWAAKLGRLPYTAEEAKQIKTILKKEQVKVYQDKRMTNGRLMSEAVRGSKILHIATHGFYDPATPDVVGVATYADKSSEQNASGFLSLSQLLSKPFDVDLVVISGCETMLGRYYKGSGMRSFTRGFLSQGAGSVLGTLWKIPDRSTAIFMSYFYTALKQNNGDTTQALYQAKRQLAGHERYRDPFYWAGFVLTSVSQQYEQIHLL